MPAPIALQLYSIRDEMKRDFEGSVRRIAAMGYAGVETASPLGATPQQASRLFRALGLAVAAAHLPLPIGDARAEVLDMALALGATRIVSGFGPKDYETPEAVARTCDRFNEAAAIAAGAGMTLGIHNHWWEFQPMEDGGPLVYNTMLERLAPSIFFELDTYWIKTGGLDPAEVVREFGVRAPLLHIKDGPATKEDPMTAVGDGVMDFASIVKAGGAATEWMIVELDKCATDMMQAVEKSYGYLVREGLGGRSRDG